MLIGDRKDDAHEVLQRATRTYMLAIIILIVNKKILSFVALITKKHSAEYALVSFNP